MGGVVCTGGDDLTCKSCEKEVDKSYISEPEKEEKKFRLTRPHLQQPFPQTSRGPHVPAVVFFFFTRFLSLRGRTEGTKHEKMTYFFLYTTGQSGLSFMVS